nr:unnamed protein product [Callosobruchus analis]
MTGENVRIVCQTSKSA